MFQLRFLPVFVRLCSRRNHLLERGPRPAGPVSTTTPPDVGSEFLAFFLGCLVDDLPAGVVPTSPMLKDGLSVLRKSARTGVVLSGTSSHSGARHGEPKLRIARFTEPA